MTNASCYQERELCFVRRKSGGGQGNIPSWADTKCAMRAARRIVNVKLVVHIVTTGLCRVMFLILLLLLFLV